MRGFLLTTLLLAGLWAEPALALEGKPKLAPEAVPITQQTEYLRTAPAPDYWMLSSFYLPQQTSSACSLASLAMALNALRGLPSRFLVALCERIKIWDVASVNSDFTIYRGLDKRRFNNRFFAYVAGE